jgi:hypothetical protein
VVTLGRRLDRRVCGHHFGSASGGAPNAMADAAARDLRKRLNVNRRDLFDVGDRPIAFVCECGSESCAQTVVLTPSAYDERRRDGGLLLAHSLENLDAA